MTGARTLSLIIPVYNEVTTVRSSLEAYLSYLRNLDRHLLSDFEILVVDNGSNDGTSQAAEELAHLGTPIRVLKLAERGLGLAIKEGIKQARFELAMFYSIDVPFGFEVIEDSLRAFHGSRGMVIGSKAHPESQVHRPFLRNLVSGVLQLLLRLLFGVNVRDTQGSQLFHTLSMQRQLERLDSKGAFMQVQLVLAITRMGLDVVEIPVKYTERRSTRMKMFKDAARALHDLFSEWRRPNGFSEKPKLSKRSKAERFENS